MIRKLLDNFAQTLYVQIWENRIKITNTSTLSIIEEKPLVECKTKADGKIIITAIGNKAGVESINPFSHPRTLFSDFHIGEKLLQELIKKAIPGSFISIAPCVIIHPMEKIEGGLTMIEGRAFKEMAYGAGARKTVVYVGVPLLPTQIDFNELYVESNEW
ncbi:MAG: rod shape-determining protein MreB [Gammaproteobacteria bacterium]|nr:rod shape-determining protein MreB [Gammaproteobacteria bacterium]